MDQSEQSPKQRQIACWAMHNDPDYCLVINYQR